MNYERTEVKKAIAVEAAARATFEKLMMKERYNDTSMSPELIDAALAFKVAMRDLDNRKADLFNASMGG
jgi:hypothetical protein